MASGNPELKRNVKRSGNVLRSLLSLKKNKKNGNELDEFLSHKFLESLGETLTVIALREKLRKIDLDMNGKMALLEYLCFRYSKEVRDVINAPQGDNQEEVNAAAKKLEEVQAALSDLLIQLDIQKKALEDLSRSEAELKSAVDELKAQEDAYHGQIASLEAKTKDAKLSTVQKSKAANELAQLKNEDPLPLRKAKITQEAALRKVEKEKKACEVATKRVAEAVAETEKKLKEAEDYLNEVKSKGGSAQGAIWWMERELKEAQKYLPKKKQT